MIFLVCVAFLLLNCLLSCFADVNSTLLEYMKAYYQTQAMHYHLFRERAIKNITYDIKLLLTESHRLDHLYQLKWINELISSPVFQANEVIDENTKRRYANDYEMEKRLNESSPLDIERKKLIEKYEKKWKARASLDAAEDAHLSRSSATCLKKEVNITVKVKLMTGEKQIRELKKAADKRLYEIAKAYKQFMLNDDDTRKQHIMIEDLLILDTLSAEMKYGGEIDALVNKTVEVERQRLHYLKLLCPGERVKVLIDSVTAES
ncbi:unnamed protein product [Trichobilharzia szidati]|nr:unnamed protein product [Trichobilharzia szidati]